MMIYCGFMMICDDLCGVYLSQTPLHTFTNKKIQGNVLCGIQWDFMYLM